MASIQASHIRSIPASIHSIQASIHSNPASIQASIHVFVSLCAVPVVEFAHNQTIRFKEPLYNTSLNSTLTLQLQRSGDLSFPITVYYSTNDQSARSGYDFEHTLGIIRFAEEESSAKISIRVLANHASSADREFGVQLSLDTSRDSKSGVEPNGTSNVPVQLGAMSRVTVCILNYVVTGPYFPTPPLLDNVRQDGVRSYSSGLYFDLPLACITVSRLSHY